MMNKKRTKHDQYIDVLVKRFAKEYEFMATNVEYKCPDTKVAGEIDIIAKNGNRFDIYEVKCNYHFEKAYEQLKRAESVFKHPGLGIRLFYYSGSRDLLKKL